MLIIPILCASSQCKTITAIVHLSAHPLELSLISHFCNQCVVQVISIHCAQIIAYTATGFILCMRPANERPRYTVTLSLKCNVVSHWLGAYTKWSLSNTPSQSLSISQIIHMDCELSHLLLLPPSVVKIPIITAGNPNPLCTDNITTHHPSHCPSLSSSTWTLSSPISHFCHHV